MKLSDNFTFDELTATSYAHIYEQNKIEAMDYTDNLKILATHILQPIRDRLNDKIYITSGFRGHTLNSKVGGSKTSQHVVGLACDIQIGKRDKDDSEYLFAIVRNMYRDGSLPKLGQCILEQVKGKYWVHVSVMSEHLFRKYGSSDARFMITYDGKHYEEIKL